MGFIFCCPIYFQSNVNYTAYFSETSKREFIIIATSDFFPIYSFLFTKEEENKRKNMLSIYCCDMEK